MPQANNKENKQPNIQPRLILPKLPHKTPEYNSKNNPINKSPVNTDNNNSDRVLQPPGLTRAQKRKNRDKSIRETSKLQKLQNTQPKKTLENLIHTQTTPTITHNSPTNQEDPSTYTPSQRTRSQRDKPVHIGRVKSNRTKKLTNFSISTHTAPLTHNTTETIDLASPLKTPQQNSTQLNTTHISPPSICKHMKTIHSHAIIAKHSVQITQ